MTDALGLSIGMTNLVAARVGGAPVTRRAVLTLYPNRPPEVGLPAQNPALTEPGVVLAGFVERVGDPVPLAASDGSSHRADGLLVEALDAMTRTVATGPPSQLGIAVPAHWGPAVLGALRAALRTKPTLSPNGVAAPLVSDAAAAFAALQTSPGLPAGGVVALVDLGGSGTSITLADAANRLEPVSDTLRYTEFSGEQIDQALMTHVLADITSAGGLDPAGTTAVGALARLREQCRDAKEQLSAQTAATLAVDMPGYRSDVRVTRTELEQLIAGPLGALMAALQDMLAHNRIPAASLSAVATVGGGAAIPMITQRLSEQLRVPVVTTPNPALNIAAGAAVLAARGPAIDDSTGMAHAADTTSGLSTGISTAAWAAGAAGAAAAQSGSDGPASSTFRALAWSQDEGSDEPVPYDGADYSVDQPLDPYATGARPQMEFLPSDEPDPVEEPLPWYRRPALIFAAALAAVLAATAGLVWTLTSSTGSSVPTSPAVTNPLMPGVPLTTPTTIIGTDGSPTVVAPPTWSSTGSGSESSSTAPTSPSTTTTSSPASTTTTTTSLPPTTTTTTPPPVTTTTPPPPVTTTTAPPVTPTKPPVTTTAAAIITPPPTAPTSAVAPPVVVVPPAG